MEYQSRPREEIFGLLIKNHLIAQMAMKQQYDKHHTDHEFEVGDLVYLKLQKYRQRSVAYRYN